MAVNFLSGKEFAKQICEKSGIDFDTTKRIVIDVPLDGIVTIYVEKIGTRKLLDIDMQSNGINIKEAGAK
jgi:hypothetical protein